jgi:hypothetical protein
MTLDANDPLVALRRLVWSQDPDKAPEAYEHALSCLLTRDKDWTTRWLAAQKAQLALDPDDHYTRDPRWSEGVSGEEHRLCGWCLQPYTRCQSPECGEWGCGRADHHLECQSPEGDAWRTELAARVAKRAAQSQLE